MKSHTKIRINESNIEILSGLDNKVIFVIWEEEFDRFRECFRKSEDYRIEANLIRKKYEN